MLPPDCYVKAAAPKAKKEARIAKHRIKTAAYVAALRERGDTERADKIEQSEREYYGQPRSTQKRPAKS